MSLIEERENEIYSLSSFLPADLRPFLEKEPMMLSPLIELRKHHRPSFDSSIRVARLSLVMADFFKLNLPQRELLVQAALLHDVGKVKVPVSILDKKGQLTPKEREKIKKHSVVALRSWPEIPKNYPQIAALILNHHCFVGEYGDERRIASSIPVEKERRRKVLLDMSDQETRRLTIFLSLADVYEASVLGRRPDNPEGDKREVTLQKLTAIINQLASDQKLSIRKEEIDEYLRVKSFLMRYHQEFKKKFIILGERK